MIEQLTFTVRFPPTDHYPLGRAFDRSFDFQKGMTAITGPNENGKTLTLEMIEFLLFGAKALRGKAEDYKHLKASGRVMIRGAQYGIERTVKNASISQLIWSRTETNIGLIDQIMAVGTKPVNARIIALLGYGLDVFRVANVANQGDAERLSKMLPTERKAMVDKLIGADQIESIAVWCGEQALGVSREIAGLESGLVEPVEPVRPEGYRPAAELRGEIVALHADSDRAIAMRTFLANEPVVMDVAPAPTEIPLATLEKAEQILQLRTYDFDLAAVTEQLAGAERWQEKQRFNRQIGPMPVLTQDEIDLQNKRNGLVCDRQRLRQTPEILCPCGKPFTTADVEIARVEAEIAAIPQLEGYAQPDLDREQDALRRWTAKAHAIWQTLQSAAPIEEPEHHPRDAKGAVHVNEVAAALRELAVTGTLAEVRALASKVREHQAHATAAEAARQHREAWEAKAANARTELAMIDVSGLPALEALFTAVTIYDAQKGAYDTALASYVERRDRLVVLRAEQISWRNGKQAMNDVRQDTKTFLAPALSRVASHMLSQMTGGARGRVVVDEDFEIQVDGQPLNTLSGSGKVCANLAVRLGLGRILTNGVFPVFMGDEMDASMDADRAGHLHDALTALEGKLHQILVITHKQPACRQVIKLEN